MMSQRHQGWSFRKGGLQMLELFVVFLFVVMCRICLFSYWRLGHSLIQPNGSHTPSTGKQNITCYILYTRTFCNILFASGSVGGNIFNKWQPPNTFWNRNKVFFIWWGGEGRGAVPFKQSFCCVWFFFKVDNFHAALIYPAKPNFLKTEIWCVTA